MKALVLSGGGSKGSYQIGVWKALRKLGIKYDIVTGTSVGALNGAIIVQNNYYKALSIWRKLNMKVLFGEDATNSTNNFEVYKMYSSHFLKYGGIDVSDLEKLIKSTLNIKRFYKSKINFGLITYNITNKKPKILTKNEISPEKLPDYLMASASCFPAFKKKNIEGEQYIDGGYYDALPINLAIDMGADEIIAVDLTAPGIKKIPKQKVKITYIRPKNKLTSFLNFYEQGNKNNIKFGYNDTMKIFNKLEGNHYTFKKKSIEKNIKLYKETYLHIVNRILKYKKIITAFEKITNLNITISEQPKKELEEKLFLKVMESLGKTFNLDETKIYTTRSFNKDLKTAMKKHLENIEISKSATMKKELEFYNKIKNEDYSSIRKEALLNPLDLLRAIYLYTICEA